MYISLYRRYRPQHFSEVVGQTAAVGVITRAIETGALGHAYLFSGPRGCGKTTVARLFAKAVNCPDRKGAEPCDCCDTCRSIVEGNCLDVIEIDGASNNKVDEIRDLKEHVALASFTCPYKVYIIDEVHMLSIGAFNALLKTLEEPPDRVIFILATTEPHKVPVTIRSRCQHIPFHGMTPEQIVGRLKEVSASENLEAEDEALWEIARNSEGGMRDALSLMEQAIAFAAGPVTRETIERLLGGGSSSSIRRWLSSCHETPEEALPSLETLFRSGAVPERFLSVLFTCVRNMWLQSRWGDKAIKSLMLSEEEREWLRKERNFLGTARLERLMTQIASLLPQVRRGMSNDVLSGLLVQWLLQTDEPQTAYAPERPEQSNRTPEQHSMPRQFSSPPRSPEPRRTSEMKKTELPLTPKNETPLPTSEPTPTQPPPTAETHAAPPVPDLNAAASVGDDLEKLFDASLAGQPHFAVPFRLSDILFDPESATVSAIFRDDEQPAFETVRSRRAAEFLASLVKKTGRNVSCVKLFWNGEQENYDIVDTSFAEQTLLNAAAQQPPQKGSVQKERFQRRKTEKNAQPEKETPQPQPAAQRAGGSLHEFLSTFPEGEVLYCRPNDKPEESSDDEEV